MFRRLWTRIFPRKDWDWCYVVMVKHSGDFNLTGMWTVDSVWKHEEAANARSKVVLGWGHGSVVHQTVFNKLPASWGVS